MLENDYKSRFVFLLALIIGGIGSFGQAYMLYHELIDCYPYKIVNFNFYRNIAENGVYLAPIVAIIIGILLGLKRFWLTTVAPVVLCPFLFTIIFFAFSFIRSDLASKFSGYDGKTAGMVAWEFIYFTSSLAITGLVTAMFCNFLMSFLSKRNKLA